MEKNLNLIVKNDVVYADSREVAEIVDKRHADLCRDIAKYIAVLTERNFAFSDFFVESSYKDHSGKSNKCYLLTKKGCDMVANKMTGEKGILFTATYIEKFYAMEQELKTTKVKPLAESKGKPLDESKQDRAKSMLLNARTRQAKLWKELAEGATGTYAEVCKTYAVNTLAGKDVLELPALAEKTYSATEVGNILGISANMVGKIANKYNLKIDKYGKWFHDKSQYSSKEIETFRYNADGINIIRSMSQLKITESDGKTTCSTTVDLSDKNGNCFCAPLEITIPKKC